MYLICPSWMNQMMSQFFNMNSRHVLFVLGWSVWEQCYKWWGAYWGSTLMGGRMSMTSGWTVSPQTCTPWAGARSWTTVWKDQGSKVSYYSPRSCFQNNYFHECIYLGTFFHLLIKCCRQLMRVFTVTVYVRDAWYMYIYRENCWYSFW